MMENDYKHGRICLCCLGQNGQMKDISQEMIATTENTVKIRLADTYKICSGIEPPTFDEGGLICLSCENTLRVSFEFRELCRRSHKMQKNVSEKTSRPAEMLVEVKHEAKSDEEEFFSFLINKPSKDGVKLEVTNFTQVYIKEKCERPRKRKAPKIESSDSEIDHSKEMKNEKKKKRNREKIKTDTTITASNFQANFFCYYCEKTLPNTTHEEYLKHRESLHKSGEGFLRLDRTCQLCHQEVRGYMKHIEDCHKDYKPNQCCVCPLSYQSQNDLKVHLISHLDIIPTHECLSCKKKFKSELLLRRHIVQEKHNENFYHCPYCGLSYTKFIQLHEHFRAVHHSKKAVYPCYYCKKCFMFRKYLMDHDCERKPTASQPDRSRIIYRTCKVCECEFFDDEEYTCHKFAECGDQDDDLKCSLCGKEFETVAQLARHKRHHNYKPQQCVCDICGHTSINQSQLILHKTRHQDERPWQCRLCSKAFKVEHRLNSHMASHKEKKYECDFCGKLFRDYMLIRQHMAVHGTVTGIKRFTCELCGKSQISSTSLKRHMQTHTGSREAKCSVCSMEFRDISTYNKHYRKIHEGLVYECKYCRKTWLEKEKFRDHLFMHRGFKPYACTACPAQFVKKYLFVKHLRECHTIAFDTKLHGYRETEDINGFIKECMRYTKRDGNGPDDSDMKAGEDLSGGIQLNLPPRESYTGDMSYGMQSNPVSNNVSHSQMITQHPYPNPYQNL